jgi:hypothetical protein
VLRDGSALRTRVQTAIVTHTERRSPEISMRLLALPLLAVLAACPNPNGTATVRFEQLGACNGYKEGNNVVSAGPNAAYVLFKVIDIDNRNGKATFAYDPTKLYVTSSNPRAHVDLNLSLAQKIGVLGTTSETVPAGSDLPHNGYAVVVVPTGNATDPQQEANTINYFLGYDGTSAGPAVLLDKKNSTQTQYTGAQDCLSKSW